MTVHVVTAPDLWQGLTKTDHKGIFLAGGITGCPDWQAKAIDFAFEAQGGMSNPTDVTLINPRRLDFPIDDPDAAFQQILWEKTHLIAADVILFWFPKQTLGPIALFELGWALSTDKNLYVGCHPDYARKKDLEIQISLVYPELELSSSVKELMDRTIWMEHLD